MAVAIIAMKITSMMTSTQPARIFVNINLRLMTVTERKMKTISITNISMRTVRAELRSFIAPTGLESITSGEDHAQNANPNIMNTTVSSTVIMEERSILLLSGVSSLTVLRTDLETRGFTFHS